MSAQRHLAQLGELRGLQRAERDLAALDYRAARDRADAARDAATADAERAVSIAAQWYECLARPHFEPELRRLIANELIAAEGIAYASADAADLAEARSDLLDDQWKAAEARSRATDRIEADVRRAVARRLEEAALDRSAVRSLARWRAR